MFLVPRILVCIFLILFCAVIGAADTLRVATYNALNLSGSSIVGRRDAFRTVFESIDPDVIAFQEISDEEGVDQLLSFALLPVHSDWTSVPYNSDSYNDNAFFYRSSRMSFLGQRDIQTTLRDITEYMVHPHSLGSADTVRIYSAHLKAGNTQSDRSRRTQEATALRQQLDLLPEGSLFLFVGDFNLYTSEEEAYQLLLDPEPSINGQLFDPIDSPGSWHNSVSFAAIHTQSPRGNFGGMDDRFDFILSSAELMDTSGSHVLPETYTPWGNDGLHFNQGVNDGVNYAVPAEVADALVDASDHLPVIVDVVFRSETTQTSPDYTEQFNYRLIHCYPNPFNPSTTIQFSLPEMQDISLIIYDLTGRQIEVLAEGMHSAGEHTSTFDASDLPSGIYFARLQTLDRMQTQKLVLIR